MCVGPELAVAAPAVATAAEGAKGAGELATMAGIGAAEAGGAAGSAAAGGFGAAEAGAGLAGLVGASGTGLDVGAGVAAGSSGLEGGLGAGVGAGLGAGELAGGAAPGITDLAGAAMAPGAAGSNLGGAALGPLGASGTGLDIGAAVAPGSSGFSGAAGPVGGMGSLAGQVGASGAGADLGTGVAGGGAGATPGGAGGGFGQIMKDVLPYLKVAAPLISGGGTVMNAVESAQANKIAGQASKLRMEAAQPALTYAQQQFGAAEAGTLTAPQQAQISQWKEQATSRINQYLSNAGLLNSSVEQQWKNWIDQQAMAMQADMVQQSGQNAIQASQAASGSAPTGTNPNALSASLLGAQQTLAQLAAVGG